MNLIKIVTLGFVLLILSLLLSFCSFRSETSAWDYYGINGSVESTTVRFYSAKKVGETWKKEELNSVIESYYEESGKIERINTFDNKEELVNKIEFIYSNNQLQKILEYNLVAKGQIYQTVITEIESTHKILQSNGSLLAQENSEIEKQFYTWQKNRIVKTIAYVSRESRFIASYKYNSNDQLISKKFFFENPDKPNKEIVYNYEIIESDENGNWLIQVKGNPYNKEIGDYEERTIVYFD